MSYESRYAIFSFTKWYPAGGWDDLVFLGTREEVLDCYEDYNKADFTQIVDLVKGKKVTFRQLCESNE